MREEDPAGAGWHLDRRVPVAIIFTIIFQTMGAVWFAATLNFTVEANKRDIEVLRAQDIADLRTKIAGDNEKQQSAYERLIRLEEATKQTKESVDDAKRLLQQLIREQRTERLRRRSVLPSVPSE